METSVEAAYRRKHIFNHLSENLKGIRDAVLQLDKDARFYLFGSVPAGTSILSSDIDILIITELPVEVVISNLWKNGFSDPFEFHVRSQNNFVLYRNAENLTPF
ncbi:MAG: nucleotidyltransferase domain-containing protein [Thermoplasmataceae archaeon]